MPTRVTPYLGGTGQDNTRKLNVHPTLQSVSIGADQLGAANLNVYGNTHSNIIEAGNTFISSAGTSVPTQAFVGAASGSRWYGALGSAGYAWYSDSTTAVLPGYSSATYRGSTYYPKIVFTAAGSVNSIGGFATGTAFIRGDGTATFGTLTLPSRNTMAVLGNVYIDGNVFVTGNTFQITNSITAANANVVSANAFVVTKVAGSDIPVSNGITFSGANLVMSAYGNPIVNFSANNNVWVNANTTIVGSTAANIPYNPYQLVDDGLVVMHNSGRGNILQTWVDGRTGVLPRAWGLGITNVGDLAWLVSTAPNTKPSVTRMSIDQNGNVKFGTGTGTNSKSNVLVDGNVHVASNLTVGTYLTVDDNVYINRSAVYDRVDLGGQLTILQPGNITPGVPFIMTSATSTLRPNGASWGFGINQLSQEGRFSIMMGANLAMQPNVEIFGISRATSNVDVKTNLFVTGTSGANVVTASNIYMGQTTIFNRESLATRLVLLPHTGNPTEVIQSISTGTATTGRSTWGFGINQGGELGRFSIMKGGNAVTVANVEVMYFGHTMPNVVVTTNVWSNGSIGSPTFHRANVVNEAAVQSAVTSRGWPKPIFGFIATPDVEPPSNYNYVRTLDSARFNSKGIWEPVSVNTIRHLHDISGKYLGISSFYTRTQTLRWSNNLSITDQINLSNVVGTFEEGELITCSDNSNGIYMYGTDTIAGVSNGNGGVFNGFITGANSLATADVTLNDTVWTREANIIATANQIGIDGIYGSGTLLEATGNNAIIRQTLGGSTSGRALQMFIKRVSGNGAIRLAYKTTTSWAPILDDRGQEIFVIPTDRYIQGRANGVNTNSLAPAIMMDNANDKVIVGYFGLNSGSGFLYPHTPLTTNTAARTIGAEAFSFDIPNTLTPNEDFTFYMKGRTNPDTGYLLSFSDGSAANAINFQINSNKLGLYLRNNADISVLALDTTARQLSDVQDFSVVCRVSPRNNNSIMVGNDRLYASNTSANAIMFTSPITKVHVGRDGGGGNGSTTDIIIKELMVWPYPLDDETMRLIGNGTKERIPRPFIENAAQMRPVIQALTKLKTGGNAQVSIECVSDNFGSGAAATASWPKLLATYLDTTYSNSQAAAGWWPGGTNLGPARNDILTSSFPVGSWTQTLRTEVGPSLGTSTTSSAGAYIYTNIVRALGDGAACRVFYVGTADGQAEYSWDNGATRTPLDFTAAGVGNVGYYDLVGTHTTTGTLRLYRLAGTIRVAGLLFTNSAPGVVIHKMCNAGGLTRDWYNVDSTQWRTGYEAVNPTASIIMLGTYDQAAAYNEESFAYFLQDMINRRRATVANRPIMIVMPPDNLRSNTTPMDFYSREARKVAALNNCTFVDLQWMFGNSIADYDLSWWDDSVNPTPEDGGPALVAGILRALENAGT